MNNEQEAIILFERYIKLQRARMINIWTRLKQLKGTELLYFELQNISTAIFEKENQIEKEIIALGYHIVSPTYNQFWLKTIKQNQIIKHENFL
jgi:hypothetical protein